MSKIELLKFFNSDEYCPHCDNHYVVDAVIPKPSLKVEGEDARIDSRFAATAYWYKNQVNKYKNAKG